MKLIIICKQKNNAIKTYPFKIVTLEARILISFIVKYATGVLVIARYPTIEFSLLFCGYGTFNKTIETS